MKLLKTKQEEGLCILAVSHKIDEIYQMADRITVLRNGDIIYSERVGDVEVIDIIRMAYTQTEQTDKLTNRDFHKLFNFNLAILNDIPMNIIVIDDHGLIKVIHKAAKKHFNLDLNSSSLNTIDTVLDPNKETIDRIHELLAKNERGVLFDVPIILADMATINNIFTLPVF